MSAPFSWLSPVFFDELDLNGALHNARFAVHVERAQSALFEQLGLAWTSYAERDPDLRYVVRALHIGFLAPLESPGALLVELVFNYPGVGNLLLQAVLNQDYPLLQGIFLVITLTVLAANLIADFVYVALDPRVRQEA